MTSLKFRVAVVPTLRGEPTEEERDSGAFDVEADWADETREVSLRFTRCKSNASFNPGGLRDGLMECFGSSGAGHYTFCRATARNLQLYASSFPLAVTRIVNAIYPDCDESWVPTALEVRNGRGPGFRLTTEVLLSISDPDVFPSSSSFSALEAICTPTDPDAGLVREPSPAPGLQVEEEASTHMGDVRAHANGQVAAYESVNVNIMWQPPQDAFDRHYDALTFIDTDPVAKYEMLGSFLRTWSGNAGDAAVLIFGDHPGVLGRYLSLHGVDSVGIDPLNDNKADVGERGGSRRLIQGEVFPDDPRGVIDDDFYDCLLAVCDTVNAGESAELSTARNVALGEWVRSCGLGSVIQLRSAPLSDGVYNLLKLEGYSKQGCEQYAFDVTAPFDWKKSCWARVARREGVLYAELASEELRFLFTPFFGTAYDNALVIPDCQWYNFLATRAWLEAALERDPVARAARQAPTGMDLLVRTSVLREGMSELERRGLRNLYDPDRVVDTPGLPPGLLDRMPGMRGAVRARYRSLLEVCAPSRGKAPPELIELFTHARNANILHRLSAVRATTGFELALAEFERVLPYEHMACLGSYSLFRAVWRYLQAHRAGIGKLMHPWELQRLLWGLTHFGKVREKYRYVLMLLEDAVTQPRRGRAPVEHGAGSRHAYNTFAQKLMDLGLGPSYSRIDVRWRDFVIAHPANVRGSSRHGTTPLHSPMPPSRSGRESQGAGSNAGSIASVRSAPGFRRGGSFAALSFTD